MVKHFYVTTPIYYPSGEAHIGTAYTTILADVIARYKRLRGYDVRFLTGLDEHGQKIEAKAIESQQAPQAYVDEIQLKFCDLWQQLGISYDDFLRTTEKRHQQSVQYLFQRLQATGDIYLGEYEGYYCAGCETYYMEHELNLEESCCQYGHHVETIKEPSYFFKMSAYADRLLAYYQEHPDWLNPNFRMRELVENFLKPGLQDLAISRTSFKWGINVPDDPKHVIYVWLDALSNYITALGYGSSDQSLYDNYWVNGEVYHIIGKDITRFHAIYWPIILMALDLPLPKQIIAHGFILMEGQKMSKSLGNVISPYMLLERYGSDATRYYLMRDSVFGQDWSISPSNIISRINSEIVNDYANLVSRTIAMVNKYFEGVIEMQMVVTTTEDELQADLRVLKQEIETAYDQFDISRALQLSNDYVRRLNQYIDLTAPWQLAKDVEKRSYLATVLLQLVQGFVNVSHFLYPVMPQMSVTACHSVEVELLTWEAPLLRKASVTKAFKPLMLRLKVEEELAYMKTYLAQVSE